MTLLTCQARVGAGQREVAEVVVKVCIMPIRGVMAGGAIGAVLTVVIIILLMTGITIHRRASGLPVYMTRLTGYICVFALQLESRQAVIELCRSPAIRGVTLTAIQPEAAIVRLVVMVTGVAVLQRYREVAQGARVDMALHTGKTYMPACQLE